MNVIVIFRTGAKSLRRFVQRSSLPNLGDELDIGGQNKWEVIKQIPPDSVEVNPVPGWTQPVEGLVHHGWTLVDD